MRHIVKWKVGEMKNNESNYGLKNNTKEIQTSNSCGLVGIE